MKNMKTTATVLALSMALGMIGNVVVQAEEEPLEISIIVYNQAGYNAVNGTEVQKIIEERFNVKFDVVSLDIHNREAFSLYFAQGGDADVIYNVGDMEEDFIKQGLLREISEEDLYEKMPVYMEKMNELVGDGELVKNLIQYDGKNYCIPFTHGPAVETGLVIVRQDWMENVGISSVTTLEEFEALLDAFTYGDPDGDGIDNTYGINGATASNYGFNSVWSAYGISPKSFYVEEDEIIYTSITEKYKEGLKLLNKWYEAGYIDPEFVTDDRTTQRNKWSEGKLGVLEDNAFWCDSARGEGSVLKMLEAKDENATFAFLDPFTGPYGDSGSKINYPALRNDGAIFFGANASDEVVAKMMEIKEAFASEWETYERGYYGIEGEDFEYDESGRLIINADESAEDYNNKGIRQTWALMPITFEWMEKTMTEKDKEVHEKSLSQNKIYNGITFATNGSSETWNTKGTDVEKIVDEYYYNAITGKVDIDSTWDEYVEKALDAGLRDVLAEYNEIRIK